MKLPPGTPLSVSLAFFPEKPFAAARLALDRGLAQLEWTEEFLKRGLNLSPVKYPPERGLQEASREALDGLHGFLADSLPDQWGRKVMQRRLARLDIDLASLNVLEQLALVGREGRGALIFDPVTTPPGDVEGLDLDALAQASASLLADEEIALGDTLARLAGGSGGARPKIHVGFGPDGSLSAGDGEVGPGHQPWIVKFPARVDYDDIGPIEEAYASMADAAGVTMSEHRLIPAKKGPGYFATRRFDRLDGGKRLHMLSLAGAIESDPRDPSEYDTLLRATHLITRRADDVAAAFQRMLFNILAHNRDDHTKQHAYLMDERGDWRLAPAYDLTYAHGGQYGEHNMAILGEGKKPTHNLVETLGKNHGIKNMEDAIDKVRSAVSEWPKFAKAAGVSKDTLKMAKDAHERVWNEFQD